MYRLRSAHPSLASVVELGKSYEGRNMLGMTVEVIFSDEWIPTFIHYYSSSFSKLYTIIYPIVSVVDYPVSRWSD